VTPQECRAATRRHYDCDVPKTKTPPTIHSIKRIAPIMNESITQ
jgi:hypothetical protein